MEQLPVADGAKSPYADNLPGDLGLWLEEDAQIEVLSARLLDIIRKAVSRS